MLKSFIQSLWIKAHTDSYRHRPRVAPLEAENKTRRLKTNKVSIYMPEEDEHLNQGKQTKRF